MTELLARVKLALRVTEDDFDDEIQGLICSARRDLGIVDINEDQIDEPDALVTTAIVTYCKMHFGQPDEYARLKASYDEQKAQLITSSSYTDWRND